MLFIEESLQHNTEEVPPFIKLSDVRKFYQTCLQDLNAEFISVNATRLKTSILELNENLEATPGKKEVLISFKDDLAEALRYTREHSAYQNAAHLIKAASIIKKDMLDMHQDFTGSFSANCQRNSLPQTLLSMLLILTGFNRNVGDVEPPESFKPALSLAQLIQFNSAQNRNKSRYHRYSSEKETPLSIYNALLVHAETRSRVLIDKLHDLGLCISYHRMLSLSTSLGNSIFSQFKCKIFDGPAIANILPPVSNCKTFSQYAREVFVPYLKSQARSLQRIDLVFDRYFKKSLKSGTRSKRSTGVRRKVTENGMLPNNWRSFLRCSENKKELFIFLSQEVIKEMQGDILCIATAEENVICNQEIDIDAIASCNI